MDDMSDGGPAINERVAPPSSSTEESSSGSRSKSGSIRVEPRKIVFVRIAKKRVISPRWNASHALELLKPQRH